MKQIKPLAFLAVLISGLAIGCAQQHRTNSAQVSAEDMVHMLSDADTALSGTPLGPKLTSLKNDPATTIYAASSGPSGTVASVLGFNNLDFLGLGPGINYAAFSAVRVFFLDRILGAVEDDALVIGLLPLKASDDASLATTASGYVYVVFTGLGSINGRTFSADLASADGTSITVLSRDVGRGALNPTIQLRVEQLGADGKMVKLGKFSALAGYQ